MSNILGIDVPPDSPLWQIPAMQPPEGVTPNFDNPESLALPINVLNGVFPALAFIALCIRLYARAISAASQRTGWDDAFCILAMLGSIAHTTLMYISVESGYGRHLYDIQALSLTPEKLRIKTIIDETYIIGLLAIKISILIMYRRLFGIYKTSKRLIDVGFVANILVTIPYLGVAITRTVQCDGIDALKIDLCQSYSVSTTVVVFGVFNTLLDFYTLLIPINRVHQMKVARRTRFGLVAIFLTGMIACFMSTVRLIIVAVKFDDHDVFWTAATISPYTIVELNLAIICACMMFVPQVVRKMKGETSTSSYARSSDKPTKSSYNPPTIGGGAYRAMRHSPTLSQPESKKSLYPGDSWERSVPDLNFLTDPDESITALPTPPRAHMI